jgi:Txe/YoeB family toxin of Txe-Axe toxin-antitoxin module
MEKSPKIAAKFVCESCDYKCNKHCDYDKHLMTTKHKNRTGLNILEQNVAEVQKKFICKNCNKNYSARNSLWYHQKTCKTTETSNDVSSTNMIEYDINNKDQLILMLIKQNAELVKETSEFKSMMMEQQNMMMEVIKNGTNNTTHTNSHNKAFNLNLFLNETCKNAMNITDFVESIQLQLSDLEKVGEIGYVEGISNIIVKNLNALDVTQRPVHCTDKKRETIYIKDEDKWEKDEEKNKIRKVIKKVSTKNARLIQKFKEKHPDYNEYHSKYSTQYHKLIIESMGGSGDNDLEKEDKIIRNIAKNIVVDK